MNGDTEIDGGQHDGMGSGGTNLVERVRLLAQQRTEGSEPPRILDVGCGTGDHLDALAEIGPVTGIDSSPALVERARELHPQAELAVADACALPFENAFDIAFSHDVFHWVPDQVALLKSVASALVDGGHLVVEMGAEGNLARIEKGYTEALRHHSGDYAGRFCFPREASYRRLLGIAGFEVEELEVREQPAPLAGGRAGLRLLAGEIFGRSLSLYRDDERAAILDDLERACEPELWDDAAGCWTADYRRLTFTARKARRVRAAGGASQLDVLGK